MKRPAFTLVELLVVIAIVGLLSTVAVVALSSSRRQARNAKRIADVKQLVTAFDLGLDANGTYPAGLACISTECTGSLSWVGHNAEVDAFLSPFITTPSDPVDGEAREQGGYVYIENWVDGGVNFPPGTYLQYYLEPPATCGVGGMFTTTERTVNCVVKLN